MESLNPKVLGYHTSHNASVALVEDGKVSWGIEEERVSRRKHDQVPALAITNYLNDNVDNFRSSSVFPTGQNQQIHPFLPE